MMIKKISQRIASGWLLVCVALVLAGCATQLGAPVATTDNILKAKASGMTPVQVGDFSLAPGKEEGMDTGISIRAASVSAPTEGSFSQYLKATLITELKAAGLLDPSSHSVIRGYLTQSEVNSGITEGSGSLGARFIVTRDGRTVFDKELVVSSKWESSFVGAVAIPVAINEYTALYRKLVAALLDDSQFRAALNPSPPPIQG